MLNKLFNSIKSSKARSAWRKGVKSYALELLEELHYINEEEQNDIIANPNLLRRALLNGASDWLQYSEGGCSLIFNHQIAERLCTKSELRRNNNGDRNPNSKENWIQCQARALAQACSFILYEAYKLNR